jgi:hypothetical protein
MPERPVPFAVQQGLSQMRNMEARLHFLQSSCFRQGSVREDDPKNLTRLSFQRREKTIFNAHPL